jgi:hypothetical protein
MFRFFPFLLFCVTSFKAESQTTIPLNGMAVFKDLSGATIQLETVMDEATRRPVEIIRAVALSDGTMEVLVGFVEENYPDRLLDLEGKQVPYFEAVSANGDIVSSSWIAERFSRVLILPLSFLGSSLASKGHQLAVDAQTAIVYIDSHAQTECLAPGNTSAQICLGDSRLSFFMDEQECPVSFGWDENRVIKEIRHLPCDGWKGLDK